MPIVQHNPPELFPRYRCYTHATEVRGDSRLLIISGLNGYLSQAPRHACAVVDGDLLSAIGLALEARGRSDGGDLIG